MPPIRSFFRWLHGDHEDFETWIERQPKPAVRFDHIEKLETPPANDALDDDLFYVVSRQGKERWALFRCPCGCNAVVTLSLQRVHNPRWRLRESTEHRPTLRPSVWRDVGCMSHFFVHDGRIYWCRDTGASPWDTGRER